MSRSHLSIAPFLVLVPLGAQAPPPEPVVAYTIPVRLDAPARSLVVENQTVRWRNTTAVPVSELRFHLYLNAFRDRDSTMMRESSAEFRALWRSDEFGGIDVTRLQLVSAESRTDLSMRFVQPDDSNAADRTVLAAELPAPVEPGQTVEVELGYESRLPKAYRRTGWTPDDGFLCAQWFPKLGVLQEQMGRAVWVCPQYHARSEFFADFGSYDVAVDVPASFVVGATGGTPQTDEVRDDRRVLRFVADDVHDFAWVADPDYVVHKVEVGPFKAVEDATAVAVAGRRGVPVAEFDQPAIDVRLLLQPEHATVAQRDRHVAAVRNAVRFFGVRFGTYPYRTLTVVDPGSDMSGRRLGGGMEYPMLITCGTQLYPHRRHPQPDGVITHEFGHQYWYGMVANDEFREAWLDEGINTYSEGRAQFLAYHADPAPVRTTSYGVTTLGALMARTEPADPLGVLGVLPMDRLRGRWWGEVARVGFEGTVIPRSPLLALMFDQPTATGFREARHTDAWNDRAEWLAVDNPDAMVRPSWQFLDRDCYMANSYGRPATLLRTLERKVDHVTWWSFLRAFHERYRFGHPTTRDFDRMLEEQCGAVVAQLFRDAIVAGGTFDYGVERVSPRHGGGPIKTVVVRRYGLIRADVRVRFRFAGRDAPVWRDLPRSEAYPWQEFRFEDPAEGPGFGQLVEVWVDPPAAVGRGAEARVGPAGVHLIDANLLNNAWRARPDRRPALYRSLRTLLQTQARLTFASWIG